MPSVVSVVVHPSPIFREGLASILANSPFEPACSASSTEDVPSRISDSGEQVLVLIGVRETSHLAEALSATKACFPDAYLVVVGDATKRRNVTTALELGATSFVDENVATSILVKELELVALGEPMISVFILKQLLGHCCDSVCNEIAPTQLPGHCSAPAGDALRSPDTEERQAERRLHLSGREAAILRGLVQGAPNKVIANELMITEATVKVHVKAILRKIRAKNRTQAAIWALNGLTLPARQDGEGICAPPDLGIGALQQIG
jgi:two-component system, NarL family, nitrate/nitrite response regulator NarL